MANATVRKNPIIACAPILWARSIALIDPFPAFARSMRSPLLVPQSLQLAAVLLMAIAF
jgi:hypothetical protein